MLVMIIGFSMIRNLKVLAPFSLVANIISIGGKATHVKGIRDEVNVSLGLFIIMQYVIRSHKPLKELPLITSPAEWPVFFASAMYVFEGIALVSVEILNNESKYHLVHQVLPIQQKMKEPESYGGWNGVLNIGMLLVTIVYFIVGFFGYLRYGSDARGSITLNLPNDNM